jgi:hypothetical protein
VEDPYGLGEVHPHWQMFVRVEQELTLPYLNVCSSEKLPGTKEALTHMTM